MSYDELKNLHQMLQIARDIYIPLIDDCNNVSHVLLNYNHALKQTIHCYLLNEGYEYQY